MPSSMQRERAVALLDQDAKDDARYFYSKGHQVFVMSYGGLTMPVGSGYCKPWLLSGPNLLDANVGNYGYLRSIRSDDSRIEGLLLLLEDPDGHPTPSNFEFTEARRLYQSSRSKFGEEFNWEMLRLTFSEQN